MKPASILMIGLFVTLCACGEVEDKGNNEDPNSEPAAAMVEVGTYSAATYQPLAEGDPIEIISGFQGGWHIEPVLHVEGVDSSELSGSLSMSVETTDGVLLASSGEQELEPGFFDQNETGWSYFSFPVIFDVEPFGYEGQEVVVIAVGDVAGESFDVEQRVTLVNETDELEGFGRRG